MTKNKKVFTFILATFALFFFTRKTEQNHLALIQSGPQKISSPTNKTYIDKNRKPLERLPASESYVNTPSPNWEAQLKTSLAAQGGSGLKDIKIKKENSLIWMRDENPLHVESVVVTLINKQDVEASFRALVDSQTGKVLEPWDRTVFDPAIVKTGFRIKLDPRYTN